MSEISLEMASRNFAGLARSAAKHTIDDDRLAQQGIAVSQLLAEKRRLVLWVAYEAIHERAPEAWQARSQSLWGAVLENVLTDPLDEDSELSAIAKAVAEYSVAAGEGHRGADTHVGLVFARRCGSPLNTELQDYGCRIYGVAFPLVGDFVSSLNLV